MAKYISKYTVRQFDEAVGQIVANKGTNGQVLVADGSGGVSWQTVVGGDTSNIIYEITEESADTEVPSAKAVYDYVNSIMNTTINDLDALIGGD